MSNNNNRFCLLNEAKFLAVEGKYEAALKVVNQLLIAIPNDLDGLRLKGNIFELEIAENTGGHEHEKNFKLTLAEAKKCYERILEIEPNNIFALIDLGDYWQNQTHLYKSLNYYNKAIELLKKQHFYLSLEDELIEAFRGKKEVLNSLNKIDELSKCKQEEKNLLSNIEKNDL